MRPKHLGRLEEVSQSLEDGLDQVLLLDVNRFEHERDQLWVLLQDSNCVSRLSQIVYCHNCKAFKAWDV